VDPEAVTVVGQPQTHHIVRYENLYQIARQYDLGFWELARYQRSLDHFYLPWETDMDIPTQWVIPERSSYPGYLLNVAELRGYRFFPEKNEVYTFPIGIGVLDYKTPIGKSFRVQSKSVNPGWRIPKGLQAKYGMSFMPPGDDNPVGSRWMGLSHYGLHGTHGRNQDGQAAAHGLSRQDRSRFGSRLRSRIVLGVGGREGADQAERDNGQQGTGICARHGASDLNLSELVGDRAHEYGNLFCSVNGNQFLSPIHPREPA